MDMWPSSVFFLYLNQDLQTYDLQLQNMHSYATIFHLLGSFDFAKSFSLTYVYSVFVVCENVTFCVTSVLFFNQDTSKIIVSVIHNFRKFLLLLQMLGFSVQILRPCLGILT